ncbi:neurobeachin-like protein 1 isoform X2 [Planococcus citri]|uniref:neurobeachin-like protein 1 isoform X2 n=1 Tax=Planococcus citri TaxID=170843 RepID=UPI0031FA0659
MESKKDIYSFWIHYTTKNEEVYFRKFISGLVSIWEKQLNLNWSGDETLPVPDSIKPDQGPHLSRLPEELLPAIGKFLYITKDKTEKEDLTSEELKEAGLLVRTLILISRNFGNVSSVASSDYVHLIISIASNIMSKIAKEDMKETNDGIEFCIQCCHLLECLYDPYFMWRYFKRTSTLTSNTQLYKSSSAAFLHIEVVPFIFEYFEQKISKSIPVLSFELLNVLGAVVSGSQCNALTGVCPATASLLVTIISDYSAATSVQIIAIKCFIIMMHTLLSIEPHQRQIEISTLLEQYRGCISNVVKNVNNELDEEKRICLLCVMIEMLSTLIDLSDGDGGKLVRCIMVQNFVLESVLDALEKVEVDNKLTISCIKTLANIIKDESFSKERMIKINGYSRIFRKIKLIENLDCSLLTVLVEMAIEEKYEVSQFYELKNSKLIVPLLQLLPSLEARNQEWLTSVIFSICSCNLQCKWKAITCGSIKVACEVLQKYNTLTSSSISLLINLIENLASISISTLELKNIFNLFLVNDNKLCPYYLAILQMISNITRTNSFINCRSYFDVQCISDGINIPEIKKWPGSIFGFSFHCWFSLNKINSGEEPAVVCGTSSFRRQLFTLLSANKQGIEIHVNAENILIIIINTKKEFIAISLFDFTFEENRWYCLDVTYVPAKRPFAQNQIVIFIDGIQQLVATAKFAHITEAFTWCRIAAPIDDASLESDLSNSSDQGGHDHERSIIPSFITQVPNYITFPLRSSSTINPYVKSFPVGMQSTIFGPAVALCGQIGSVCLFQEPLTAQQIKLLYEAGINSDVLFNIEENVEFVNFHSKLVFSFSSSACAFDHAVDLCSKHKLDGRTTATICVIHSLKESVNSIGGVNVFLPFFETDNYTIIDNSAGQSVSLEDFSDMSDFAISNFRNVSEVQLEDNPVAVVVIIIKNLLKDLVNQEYFLKRHGFAMLGKLLAEVSVNLMDVPVLVSVCMLSEAVSHCKNMLLQRTYYQNVLFNFDIWSKCDLEVQHGHVQYLYSFIKKDKKFFKKRFGVQFFLDVIRMHLSNIDTMNFDAAKAVRVTIFGIINFYIQKEINVQELHAIVGYIVACGNDVQIIEALEMLINHLTNKMCTDQLYLLLYEQHCADLFYSFLVESCYGENLKKTVLRLFSVLLRTDRVYERSKLRLQLQDYTPMGLYPGLVASFPADENISMETALLLLDQILMSETSGGFTGALVLLCRLSSASLDVKLEAARKILAVVFMKPSAPVMFAKQIGWQDSITRLLIHHPIKQNPTNPSETTESEKLSVSKDKKPSDKNYPSIIKDVTSFLVDEIKNSPLDGTESVSSLVSDNIQFAASNISSAAENVSSMVAENIHFAASNLTSAAENVSLLVTENIQFAADSLTSVAENVTSAVTGNINFAAENISSVVGSAYSLITQKTPSFERNENSHVNESKAPVQNEDFTLINFDDLSLSHRSFSNGSIDEISGSNRSHSSHSKYSPSHSTSKDSISVTSMQSGSNDSDLFDDNEEERVIFDMLEQWRNLESEKEEDKEQELCNAIINILFTIMWKGYDAHQKLVWKERGQVMACINMIGLNNALYCSHLELKLRLLELMLQAAMVDLIDNAHVIELSTRTENANQLLRWVYDLFVADPSRNDSKNISIKLLDGVIGLLDVLLIFRENPIEETPELVKASFAILLKSAANKNTELCAIATAKLHTIIQTRKISVIEEECYILYLLNEIIVKDVQEANMEHYSFMAPVIKTLLGKVSDLLPVNEFLSDLNFTNPGSGFFEKFQKFCVEKKWSEFLEKEVKMHYDKYKNSLATDLTEVMNVFWAECYEAYKINSHKKNKMVCESKERFEDVIYKPYLARKEEDNIRFSNVLNQYRNHRILLRKKWKVQKNYLIGPRRAWKDSPKEAHWRLSHHENFSRMRLKLIPNLHFDSHKDASNLRDNTGWSKLRISEEIALPLNISQAALRHESDSGVEQSSEAELINNQLEESELDNKSDVTQGTEKLLITCDSELVTLMSVIKGKIEITTNNFYFYDLSQIKEDGDRHDFKWSIYKLREIYLRRYNLRKTALEFFLTDQTNYFLNFNKEVRNNVFNTLMRLRPPNLLYHSYKSPSDLLRSSGLTQKWVNREITNFDYLMQLNTIAGRTYNDLSQYPVFPWILADYESDELDLSNPAVFRDLSRPIGVVNPLNEAEVRSKYNTFEDPCGVIAKFHYGTHYSNSAGVLHYLVRVEPFTTLHIDLQSGRFDVADRQFHSIPQTWKLLMENPNDVKELIPEFFYFPEFLKNINKFDLGVLQGTKEKVDDVILPKWASSPEDFIYKHRKALESEYVSSHLHEWIDLIFGYKQRGPHAIKALNVFYYCSYEGAVDLDAIEDPTEREAVEGMINNFGQTPSQLLKESHPQRLSLNDALLKMLKTDFKKPDLTLFFDQLTHFQIDMASDRDPIIFLNSPRSTTRGFLMSSIPDALITVSRNGYIGMHSWTPHDRYSAKGFSVVVDDSVNNTKWRRDLSGSFHPSIKLHNKLFVVSHDSKLLFSAGHWDCSIKIYSFTKNKFTHSLLRHTDLVTCLAIDSCGWYLISGSKDCTAVVWDINTIHLSIPKPYQLLHGHDEPITCVAISTELDMAVSGSQDGTVNVYTVHEGHLVHTLSPEGCVSPIADVTFVTISVQGQIAFSVTDKVNHSIHVYSINGENLGSKYILGQVTSLTTVNDCVVVTDDAGDLTISRLLGLHPMFNIPLHIPIQTAVATSGNTHLLVPLRDGHLVVIGLPNN